MAAAEPAAALIGVVIVTYNSRKYFSRLRQSLEAQTHHYRLIIIDNASRTEERPMPSDFPDGAEIIQMDANTGFAAANNLGVARLDTPLVALLNPDAFPAPDWLEKLAAAAAAHPEAAAFGSTQISAEDVTLFDGLGDCYHVTGIPWRGGYGWPVSTGARDGEVFSPCAAAALYRKDVWTALGGLDEGFFCYCEDVDFGFRIWLAGYRVRQVSAAVVEHVGGASSGKRSDFAVYHGTRNRLWTFVKNMPTPLNLVMAPAHMAVTLAFLMISPFRGTGAATWLGVAHALAGVPAVLKSRSDVQLTRKGSMLKLMSVMAWSPLAMIRRAPVVRQIRTARRTD